MIAHVITLWDFLPMGLAVAGFIGVVVLTLGFSFSPSRREYLQRWKRHFALLALAGVFGGLWYYQKSKRLAEAYRRAQLYRGIREIELASYLHFDKYGTWPAGSNPQVIQLLSGDHPPGDSLLIVDHIELSVDGAAIDPWGSELVFEITEPDGLKVRSLGPDRISGTKDDLPRKSGRK